MELGEGVSVVAFAILLIIGIGLWTFTANFWVDRGMDISTGMRILVYIVLIPVTYGIAYIWANKE